MDSSDEDGRDGAGFKWCIAPDGHVRYFPFMAVSFVRSGKRVEFFGSGNDYDQRKQPPDGSVAVVGKLRELLGAHPESGVGIKPGSASNSSSLHIRFNPEWDAVHVVRFLDALRLNGGYCVCQPKSNDTLCTCKSFLEQSAPGLCHCGAFEKYEV